MLPSKRIKYRRVTRFGTVKQTRIKNTYEFIAFDKEFPIQYFWGRSMWKVVDAVYEQIDNMIE
jgi:hypothetical protein